LSLSQFDLGYTEAGIGPRLALNPEQWPGVSIKPYVVGNLSWIGGTSYLNSGGAGVGVARCARVAVVDRT